MACTPCEQKRRDAALQHARNSRPGVPVPAGVTQPLHGFVVIRCTEPAEVIGWYPDEYMAKHECQIWMQDSKVPHIYHSAALFMEVEREQVPGADQTFHEREGA